MTTPRTKAPAFSAPGTRGSIVSLDDFRGRYLVLFFFPAAFKYGCTRETVRFRDAAAKLAALRADVVGVSPDPVETLRQFVDHYQVQFPILSDADGSIATAYRARFPLVDRIQRIKRLTFIVDPEGFIEARLHHELRFEKHADEAVALLEQVHRGD